MVYPIKGKKSNSASFNYSVPHLYSSNMTVQLLIEIKHRDCRNKTIEHLKNNTYYKVNSMKVFINTLLVFSNGQNITQTK